MAMAYKMKKLTFAFLSMLITGCCFSPNKTLLNESSNIDNNKNTVENVAVKAHYFDGEYIYHVETKGVLHGSLNTVKNSSFRLNAMDVPDFAYLDDYNDDGLKDLYIEMKDGVSYVSLQTPGLEFSKPFSITEIYW